MSNQIGTKTRPCRLIRPFYLLVLCAVWAWPFQARAHDRELGSSPDLIDACAVNDPQANDAPRLTQLSGDSRAEGRVVHNGTALRIDRRSPHRLAALDWAVIGAYALGLLGIGWYYSRRVVTTEDYLLGGRNMRWLNLGMSLFATFLSTLTYLTTPGEIIRYGPMFLCMYLGHPFVAVVVGWFLIPRIMELKVTSAYEILEARLGLAVRMVGSTFFLLMRLLWMAVIIYASTSKILVPLMGLSPSTTPAICAILGLITVVYTSMGGLRAVVLTDVIQFLILFGAAIMTIVLVTVDMGGVAAWWPRQWPTHWPEPTWGYDPTVRMSAFGIALSAFTWWLCTCGSDQMAIQRYLATRDAPAARKVLITSLTCDILLGFFLGMLGLALLAYFRANPHLLPDGQTILTDSDQLLPRFILVGLPIGLSGLVVAGLLAAAMSSLSSGVNSSCSVITVDFIERLRMRREGVTDHVRTARYVSVCVGIVVVTLSCFVGLVKGNLLEICFKTVNLFTAPLFGLFFMALFVRWATGFGALIGAVCGLTVVIAVNFWEEVTGTKGISFIWAMPLGFLTQVAIGALASLLPIGHRVGAPD